MEKMRDDKRSAAQEIIGELGAMKKVVTLGMIYQHPKILLGMKKRGFGEGLWNGFGGKIHEGETIEEALIREIEEEAGIRAENLEKIGFLEFRFETGEMLDCHLFKTDSFVGEPMETEEMRPEWFHVDEIPFKDMWPEDLYWFPMMLAGKKFKGKFLFDRPSTPDRKTVIIEKELVEVEEL
jgi:8-oxo-dGTP diphosphatase/2-hydroxy-dATP diphosphatase